MAIYNNRPLESSSMISHRLIAADQRIDRSMPGLSIVSNLANIILKMGRGLYKTLSSSSNNKDGAASSNTHYWEYLDQKSFGSCLVGMIPVVGQIVSTYKSVDNTYEGALNKIIGGTAKGEGLAYLGKISVDLLNNKEFMVEIFERYQERNGPNGETVKDIMNHPTYRRLPEQYRKEIEEEACVGEKEIEKQSIFADARLLREEQIREMEELMDAQDDLELSPYVMP